MKSSYDVIVVGAGPAGSTAARYAAKNGCSVLLLEKDREIGVPVRCGEAVGEKGLRAVLEPKDSWLANRIDAVRLIAPNGTPVDVAHPDGGFILDRKVFDYDLARMAALEGAEVVTKAFVFNLVKKDENICGVKVNHMGNDYEIKSKIVIATDGVESRVGRWAGIKTHVRLRDMESCAQITLGNINVEHHVCGFYFSRKWAPGGYAWVFPKDSQTANVGLGISGEYSAEKAAMEYLNDFIYEKFPDASRLITVAGGVPCAPYMQDIVRGGFMMVGDAAHQSNPISGGGIIQSILAGEIAGKVASNAVNENDVSQKRLSEYPKKWYDVGGTTHVRSYRLKETVYKLTDEELNKTALKVNKLSAKNRTIISIFKIALFNHPRLIPDILKVFWI